MSIKPIRLGFLNIILYMGYLLIKSILLDLINNLGPKALGSLKGF